jgi:PAS domain S-box-containing protein
MDAEAHLAAIAESANDAIIGLTPTGEIDRWNRAAEQTLGYSAAEAVGRPLALLVAGEGANGDEKILGGAVAGGRVEHHPTVWRHKDGSQRNLSLNVSPIIKRNGTPIGVLVIARDTTEQKRAEAGAAQMRLAIESAPNGIVMADERGVITMVNAQIERMFGYDRSEMQGQSIEMLIPQRFRTGHVAQREGLVRSHEARAMGRGRDLYGRRKDGTEFPVEVGLNPVTTQHGTCVLAAIIDITDRKRMEAELAKATAELRDHAHTLEATVAERTKHLQLTIAELESVSYSLSHDLRGPLRTIQGFSQLVLDEAGDRLRPKEKELLAKAIRASERMDHLIQDVLTYTRVSRHTAVPEPLDLERLVRQLVDERPEFQPSKADIVIESPLEQVLAHEASLTQVVTNLLDNAVKFVAPGQRPRIRIRTEVHEASVNLWIEDNGIGIPRGAEHRLFTMFQRLNSERDYPGTGIGLAIVRKAVERMGGTVKVASEPGRGSKFCVQLPHAHAKP